jgi:hypothetical protein
MTRPQLNLEQLEDRCVPATWGTPWPDAQHLTLSFAPDGTQVGAQTSNLFKDLNAVAPTATWELQVLRAFQTWAVNANINIGLINDGGQAFGAAGRPQGDSRFGDVRIGAVAIGSDVDAITGDFNIMAGTWAGDVQLNNTVPFSIGGVTGPDLYSVMLHEAGHVFGFGDQDTNPTSVMYRPYTGVRTGLSAGDVSALQAFYGARPTQTNSNNSFASATPLSMLAGSGGLLTGGADGTLNTLQDQDFYKFSGPNVLGSLTVTLQRSGLSLLTPRVNVYDANHHLVASAVSTNPTGGDLTIKVPSLLSLGTYYVQVTGATQDVFSIGSYHLNVQATPVLNNLLGLVGGVVGPTVNNLPVIGGVVGQVVKVPVVGGLLSALDLGLGQTPGTDSYYSYTARGNIASAQQTDTYFLHAPTAAGNSVMTVMVWGTQNGGLIPAVTVEDANLNVLPARVLVNENGIVSVQFANVTPGATYFFKIQSAPSSSGSVGGYFLGVSFGAQAVPLSAVTTGALTPAAPEQDGTFTLEQSGLLHFVLSATGSSTTSVDLTITDSSGNVVADISAAGGNATSVTLNLAAGNYRFRFRSVAPTGQALSPLNYELDGLMLTDPQGATGTNPTMTPTQQPTTSTTGSGTTTSSPPPNYTSGSSSTSYSSNSSQSSYYSYYYYSSGSSAGPSSSGYPAS